MKKSYVKLLLDGFLFILPIIFIFLLLRYIFDFILGIISPLIRILPQSETWGESFQKLIAVIIMLALVTVCGYISRSRIGTYFAEKLNELVSKVIPGFSIIKELFSGKSEEYYSEKKIRPTLAFIDDAWLFAFILEDKNDAGLYSVFVPSAPIPTSGNLYLMGEEQIKLLDISVRETVRCITQLGMGSSEILKGKINLSK